MRWSLPEIAAATGGSVHPASGAGGGDGPAVDGLAIDSRTVLPGQMFVAIRAERDGHQFVGPAVEAGAVAILVEDRLVAEPEVPAVVVGSTAAALLDVGRAARRRLAVPVVGITGSVGKTSTKDLAAAALGTTRRTVASPRSFNNELGVPLTLAKAADDSEVAILEMGARGPGHVALLCQVARPTVGVVTAVAAAHTEMFGSVEGVARAKGELVEALPPDGLAVLNGDDPRVRAMAGRSPAAALMYSTATPAAPGAEVVAERISLDDLLRPRFTVRSPWGSTEVTIDARGAHQVGNALAALAVAAHLGVPLAEAAGALRSAELSPLRMDLRRAASGAMVLNDAYNANPASMAAALRALAAVPARRRVAVLGVMAELGDRHTAEHRAVFRLATELGIVVVPVATSDYGVEPVDGPDGVVERLGRIGAGDAILVKASRVAALEKVADRLIEL